jgi:predicted metalloprotease with PDZ domain
MSSESKDTIHYVFSSEKPFTNFLDLECVIPVKRKKAVHLSLAYWRPGRYEPGNFAKNIRGFRVFNEKNEPLSFVKTDRQTWKIFCESSEKITVRYQYYAAELNAGGCFVDDNQIYVNPIQCVFRCQELPEASYTFEIKSKPGFTTACPLPEKEGIYRAADYDTFVDSPWVASDDLQSHEFTVGDVRFFLHIRGECRPDFSQIEEDFRKFIQYQFDFWEEIPFSEYHFIFQIVPYSFYHGVEHANSTVIAIGPGHQIYQRATYLEILGISSHELFHAWNIKRLRPATMLHYDYSRENYSELGFVYEGFTTYFGDKILLGCGLFSHEEYLRELSLRLKKHIHNPGRFNYSVLESSFDTWLDGYVPGIPGRKTSIYDEGCLIAFLLDVSIFRNSKGKLGLKNVCRTLWKKHGRLKSGYNYKDVTNAVTEAGGKEAAEIFRKYVEVPADLTEAVCKELEYLGVAVELKYSQDICERYLGMKTEKSENGYRVLSVYPDSPAMDAEINPGDEIIALNGNTLGNQFNEWLNHYLFEKKAYLTISRRNRIIQREIRWELTNHFYPQPFFRLEKVESNDRLFFRWART